MRLGPLLTRQAGLCVCSEVELLWQTVFSRDCDYLDCWTIVRGYLRGQALDGKEQCDIRTYVTSYLTFHVHVDRFSFINKYILCSLARGSAEFGPRNCQLVVRWFLLGENLVNVKVVLHKVHIHVSVFNLTGQILAFEMCHTMYHMCMVLSLKASCILTYLEVVV